MDRDEEIGLFLVCQLRAAFQGHECIGVARQDASAPICSSMSVLRRFATSRTSSFSVYPVGSDTAGVMSAMAGVDNNPGKLEPQAADQGPISKARRLCRGHHAVRFRSCCNGTRVAGNHHFRGTLPVRQRAAMEW